MSEIYKTVDPKQEFLLDSEYMIVVDSNDRQIGSKSKRECHLLDNINNGLMHRGFSVFLFNSKGELLVTQRSDTKITYPSHLTNTLCSHPLYTESEREETDAIGAKRAAKRRLITELGIHYKELAIEDLIYMTRFEYKLVCNERWAEHEIDYVFVVKKDLDIKPDPNEVMAYKWIRRHEFLDYIENEMKNGILLTGWFPIMIEHFLFDWWDHLDTLQMYQDHVHIQRFI